MNDLPSGRAYQAPRTRIEGANEHTDHVNLQVQQANTRTDEANTRTDLANTRTDEANTRTDVANIRTDEANSRTDVANTRTNEANTRTDEAEDREQEIRDSELTYRRLFETAKDGILILNAETGMIVDVNPFLEELLGYSHTEFLGKKVWELGFLKDLFTNEVKFAELQEKEYVRYENLPLESAQGRRIEVEFVSNVYLVNNERVIQCNIRDISERKRLEDVLQKSMEEFRTLAEAMPQIVWAARPDGWNIYFNQQWFDYTGLTLEESLGHGWNTPFHPDDQQAALDTWQRATDEGTIYSIECRLRRLDGVYRWWLVRGVPHLGPTGEILRWFGTCTDIHELKQTEIRLMQLAAIVESSDDAIYGQDLNGIITAWNRGAEKLFGHTSAEMTGTSITRLIPPDLLDEELHFLEIIKRGETISHFETQRQAKDGRLVDVLITVSPIKTPAGQIIGVSKVVQDITQSKREEKVKLNRNMLANILDSIPQSVFWKDRNSVYLGCNGNFAKKAGLANPEDIIGKSDFDLPWPRQVAEAYISDDLEVINGTRTKICVVEPLHQFGGDRLWIETTKLPLADNGGQIFGLVGLFEDVTERKALEASLTEALITAEAGNRAKSEFLGIMSHELRTPLNGVLGCTELLTYTALDDEQKSLADTVARCGEHLLAVIKDILDFSSIEAGALKIQSAPIAVAETVELSALAVRAAAVEKGLTFRFETKPGAPDQITGDALRIRQILINLLGNAVKFTNEGSVVLRIAPDTEGSFLDFSVEDTGIGLSSDAMGLLFMPFMQLDSSTTREFGGTGLGLAISKRLAEAMGGSITVDSTVGKGSTFTLRLPMESKILGSEGLAAKPPKMADWGVTKSVAIEQLAPNRIGRVPAETHLVLVVEDDSENSVLAGKMLQSLGYVAEFATNGGEAVVAFESRKFFAILMDVVMPVMDGLEATRQIRGLESGSRVPIIALTANVMPGDRERCIAAGMDEFLSKPFRLGQLAEKLAAHSNTNDPAIPPPHRHGSNGAHHAFDSGPMEPASPASHVGANRHNTCANSDTH